MSYKTRMCERLGARLCLSLFIGPAAAKLSGSCLTLRPIFTFNKISLKIVWGGSCRAARYARGASALRRGRGPNNVIWQSGSPLVGLQPTVIASRAPHPLLEQSVRFKESWTCVARQQPSGAAVRQARLEIRFGQGVIRDYVG